MIRATYGATAMTSVSTGSTSTLGVSQGPEPGAMVLTAGSTWVTVVASRISSTTPVTNSGSAASASSRLELTVSKIFSRRNAAHAPIAMDSGIDTIAETATSTAEFAGRGPSSLVTGS